MIAKLAARIADHWTARGIVSQGDKEVYSYGLQLVLSTVFNIVVIAVLSVMANLPAAWLFFIAAFIPLRTTAGGYHAKSHLLCGLTFAAVFTLFLLGVKYSGWWFGPGTLMGLALISYLAVAVLAPVPAANKPLTQEEARLNRRKSLIIVSVFLLPGVLSFFVKGLPLWPAAMFYCGEAAAAGMLAAAKIKIKMTERRTIRT